VAVTIPEETLSEIRHAADIVEIVSEAVQLRKSGRNFMGLCPFHTEKTPSFTVNADKGIFHCFGCGAGGNVFSFLMQHAGMSFPEAARTLAERYGIELPRPEASAEEQRRHTEREELLAIHRLAAAFFRQCLLTGGEGQAARDYLNRRGLHAETLERFGIGFAPPGWERTLTHLMRKEVAPEALVRAGLAVPRTQGGTGYYDRFRNRVIFPIHNPSGQVVAFGGRVLDDSLPKYLNSPETPIFSKRRALYGVPQARGRSRSTKQALVVEGYIDVLALHQAGLENVVATLGTALSAEHVRALRGMVGADGRIVLVFDADAAGIAAAERSVPVFQQGWADARIVVLPGGHDPDTFIAERGPAAFTELMATAEEIVPFVLSAAIKRHGLTVEGKLRVVEALLPSLAAMDDPLRRELHLRQVAQRLGLEEGALLARLRSIHRSPRAASSGPAAASPVAGHPAAVQAADPFERRIVAMMLQFPEIVPEISRRGLVAQLRDDALRTIAECVMSVETSEGDRIAAVISRLERDDQRGMVAALAVGDDIWERRGCLKLLAQFERRRRADGQTLLQRIAAAEHSQDSELLTRLLRAQQNLVRKNMQHRKREVVAGPGLEKP
jgi:DNA primase